MATEAEVVKKLQGLHALPVEPSVPFEIGPDEAVLIRDRIANLPTFRCSGMNPELLLSLIMDGHVKSGTHPLKVVYG